MSSFRTASLILLAALAPALHAQVVRGTVTERTTRAPVAGVVVSMLDARGQVVGEALSDERGAFEVRAPGAGTFSLDAKRIGVRRVRVAPFALGDGEARKQDVTIEPLPSTLGAIRVIGRTACVRRPEENARVAELWEDARAALTATVLTRRGQTAPPGGGHIVRFLRKLDVVSWRVLFEDRRPVPLASAERPFRSLPAAELSRDGYVRVNPDGSTDYFAPDAEVLLSDAFLADHCFRVRPGDARGAHAKHVGLAFEPLPTRATPDVRGVLWLDARTSELRSLDFTFTWLPHEQRAGDFGGTVSFFRTPTGGWIVRSWRIRTPEFGHETWIERSNGERIPTGRSATPHVVRIREEGGAVPVGALIGEMGTVRGTVVVDTATKRALVGAMVALGGTPDSTYTDPQGRFVLPFVEPGSYTVVLRHAALDSLGIEHLAGTVDVEAGATAELALQFPQPAEVARRLCGETPVALDREAAIRFLVLDRATKAPLRGARVVVSWTTGGGAPSEAIVRREGTLDDAGAIVVCGVPAGEILRIEGDPGAVVHWSHDLRVQAGVVGWAVVRVKR